MERIPGFTTLIVQARVEWMKPYRFPKLLGMKKHQGGYSVKNGCFERKVARRRVWSKHEDDRLLKIISKYGACDWKTIAEEFRIRTAKQCRDRWHNQLNPKIRKSPWTGHENQVLLRKHSELGNHWSAIAQWLPGRTASSIKNHYHSLQNAIMVDKQISYK